MTFQPMTTEGRIQVITVLALEALGLARDHGVDDCKDGCSGDAARIHDAPHGALRARGGDPVTAPTLEEMQTARNRLIRHHHVPTDANVAIDADHLIVTLTRVEDYDRLRAELRLHPLATYRNRQTGWYSESQITLIHEIPRGVIPPQNARAVA